MASVVKRSDSSPDCSVVRPGPERVGGWRMLVYDANHARDDGDDGKSFQVLTLSIILFC